jgi:hypothetical protein
MAVLAGHPESSCVYVRFRVAIEALLAQTLVNCSYRVAPVASRTFKVKVPAIQNKKLIVVKIAVPVHTIMAINAGAPELLGMAGDKFRLIFRMAFNTGWLARILQVNSVAVCTHQIYIGLVGVNYKTKPALNRMVEELALHNGGFPTLGGVAIFA